MGLFDNKTKDDIIKELKKTIRAKDRLIKGLREQSNKKDKFFSEMISDGLKHKSKLASKHMNDKKEYLKGIKNKCI